MLAVQITSTKAFMNHLLVAETFDSFLLAEASISTANTYQIDGHINKEFFADTDADTSNMPAYEFSTWQEMKPLAFNLIKGKKTPLYFKFVLHLKPEFVGKTLAQNGVEIPSEQIKAFVATIKYDGSSIQITTGTSYNTFVMSKEPDTVWDKTFLQFLNKKKIAYEM